MRAGSDPDRLVVAALAGAAARHAGWRRPEGPARQAALLELRDIATVDGRLRTDLLAEQAGLLLGAAELEGPQAPHQRLAAELLLEVGADRDQVEKWRAEGRRRAAPIGPRSIDLATRPFTGG
jgi:hypothetical protein